MTYPGTVKQTVCASMSAIWLVAVLCTAAPVAIANESLRSGDIRIETPWARASIGTGRPVAAFITIINDGNQEDRLIKIDTPVAAKAEVHETATEDGVSRMNRVERVIIEPESRLEFRPGGFHIMLMGLNEPLVKGEKFQLDLRFARSGSISVQVPIGGPGATEPSQ